MYLLTSLKDPLALALEGKVPKSLGMDCANAIFVFLVYEIPFLSYYLPVGAVCGYKLMRATFLHEILGYILMNSYNPVHYP